MTQEIEGAVVKDLFLVIPLAIYLDLAPRYGCHCANIFTVVDYMMVASGSYTSSCS